MPLINSLVPAAMSEYIRKVNNSNAHSPAISPNAATQFKPSEIPDLFFAFLGSIPERNPGEHLRNAELVHGNRGNLSAKAFLELVAFSISNNLEDLAPTDEILLNLLRNSAVDVAWLKALKESANPQAQAVFQAAFESAIRCSDMELAAALLEAGADPYQPIKIHEQEIPGVVEYHERTNPRSGLLYTYPWLIMPALELSFALGEVEIAKCLTEYGATTNGIIWRGDLGPFELVALGRHGRRTHGAVSESQEKDDEMWEFLLSSDIPFNDKDICQAFRLAAPDDDLTHRVLLRTLVKRKTLPPPEALAYALVADDQAMVEGLIGTVTLKGLEDSLEWSPLNAMIDRGLPVSDERRLHNVWIMLDHGADPMYKSWRVNGRLLEANNYAPSCPLQEAARYGNARIVQLILEYGTYQGEAVQLRDALEESIEIEDIETADVLLDYGAEPTIDFIATAIDTGFVDMVERIIDCGIPYSAECDSDPRDRFRSPLTAAVNSGSSVMIGLVLNSYPELYDCKALEAAVWVALRKKHGYSTVQVILERRSDCIFSCVHECLALAMAISHRNLSLMNILLRRGIRLEDDRVLGFGFLYEVWIDVPNDVFQPGLPFDQIATTEASLRYFIRVNDKGVLRYLLDNGVVPIPRDFTDAVYYSHSHLIDLFVEYGGYKNGPAREEDALQMACEQEDENIVRKLLGYKAVVNRHYRAITDGRNQTRTPLQTAALVGNIPIIELLLAAGADIDAPASQYTGATALQFAAMNGHLAVARRLIGLHADCNAPAAIRKGRTALEGAAEHGRLEMANLLLQSGVLTTGPGQRQYIRALIFALANGHVALADFLRKFRTWTEDDEYLFAKEDWRNSLVTESDEGSSSGGSDVESSSGGSDVVDDLRSRAEEIVDALIEEENNGSRDGHPARNLRGQVVDNGTWFPVEATVDDMMDDASQDPFFGWIGTP